ncbi:MAG: T9SS type A sorting domain-containing protein [Sphingobacteriaceae bacterium]|nr:T9SS type A sorting domain-containing protein [Sphingobacteriaceae bacterium]
MKTSLGIKSPPPPSGDLYRIVDSIYYEAYSDGICRKTFRLKPYVVNISFQYVGYTYFTEGIGNDVGLGETVLSIIHSDFNSYSGEHWSSFLTINSSTISAVTTNTCSQTLGLKNNYYKNVIEIYPNPAHNEITLNLENQTIQNYRIIVCDLLGNEILTPTNKTFKIDGLTNGTYMIKCFNVDTREVIVSKFIKE